MNAWLQFSSGQGPKECQRSLGHIAKIFSEEVQELGISCELLQAEKGDAKNSFRSLLFSLEGNSLESLKNNWEGTLCWKAQSPFRPNHKRQNWFFQANLFAIPAKIDFDLSKIRFEAQRGSGPGGQHVNKSATAIRAYYEPMKLAVFCNEERSQHRNKMLASARIIEAANLRSKQKDGDEKNTQRQQHYLLERGNPIRTFKGKL
jgi:peptide chain release factor